MIWVSALVLFGYWIMLNVMVAFLLAWMPGQHTPYKWHLICLLVLLNPPPC